MNENLHNNNLKDARNLFVVCFNNQMLRCKVKGDIEDVIDHISNLLIANRLFNILTPQFVEEVNNQIFSSEVIRDFYLELLERFSLEITPMLKFSEFIDMLVSSTVNWKVVHKTDNVGKLFPIILSIYSTEKDAKEIYTENPWLVVAFLIVSECYNTELGSKLKDLK